MASMETLKSVDTAIIQSRCREFRCHLLLFYTRGIAVSLISSHFLAFQSPHPVTFFIFLPTPHMTVRAHTHIFLVRTSHVMTARAAEGPRGPRLEETDRTRQARIDELSLHQERNPTTVSQLMAQTREVQKK